MNRYVQGDATDPDAIQALGGFRRFPAWMWRNADILNFIGWLRSYNDTSQESRHIGFYGLDLYSLHASMECVLRYLDAIDQEAAYRARLRYACFESFGDDPQTYGYAAGLRLRPSCEAEAISQLIDLQQSSLRYARMDGPGALERFFNAQQNARVVKDAEEYYRAMFHAAISSWNLRDRHMMITLRALSDHLWFRQSPSKIVIWAHNSHVGDARATQMSRAGEWNLGQLVREHFGDESCSIGFVTNSGTVTAASEWDGPAERKAVLKARSDSYEGIFHTVGIPAFLLNLETGSHAAHGLQGPMLERAIGVIYRPSTELASHYFPANLSAQFDAVVYIDQTRAVEPLDLINTVSAGEPAETFPTGI